MKKKYKTRYFVTAVVSIPVARVYSKMERTFLKIRKESEVSSKLFPLDIDWAQFGRDAVAACREMGLDYYIKDSLRAEMDKL